MELNDVDKKVKGHSITCKMMTEFGLSQLELEKKNVFYT